MEDYMAYKKASDKVNARILFYFHLAAYVIVNILLVIVNIRTFVRYMWFIWPLFGWGIGLFLHAVGVYIFYGDIGIRDKMISKELKKGK